MFGSSEIPFGIEGFGRFVLRESKSAEIVGAVNKLNRVPCPEDLYQLGSLGA